MEILSKNYQDCGKNFEKIQVNPENGGRENIWEIKENLLGKSMEEKGIFQEIIIKFWARDL